MDTLFIVVICVLIGIALGAHGSAKPPVVVITSVADPTPASGSGCITLMMLIVIVLGMLQLIHPM